MERMEVSARFAAIAAGIDARREDAALLKCFEDAQMSCAQAAEGEAPSSQDKHLLANVQTALLTWRTVWPRLGAQPEFRAAVSREAHAWSKRFAQGG